MKFYIKIIAAVLIIIFIIIFTINAAVAQTEAQNAALQEQMLSDTAYNDAIESYREP